MYKLPRISIKYKVLSIKQSLHTLYSILYTRPQAGFAPIALVVLLLFGIAAGVLLIQNGVNFLPKAATEPSDELIKAIREIPKDAGYYIILPEGGQQAQNVTEPFPSFSVIKLWIAATAYNEAKKQGKTIDAQTESLIEKMLINSDNESGNILIDRLGFATINLYMKTSGYEKTSICRHFLRNDCTNGDNVTSPGDAVRFMQNLNDNKVVDTDASIKIRQMLLKRTEKTDLFYPAPPDVAKSFYGKSGILGEGRNEVGAFADKNGLAVFIAILAPSGGASLKEKIAKVEQALYNAGAPAAAAATGPLSGGCTQAEIDRCKNTEKKTGGCYKGRNGAVCLFGEDQSCPADIAAKCPGSPTKWSCEIVRGEIRCIYPDSVALGAHCDPGDSKSDTCRVIERTNLKGQEKRISSFTDTCSNGWKNFCRVLFDKGCEVKTDGVPDCEGAATAAAPAAAPPAAPGAPSAPGARPASAPAARPAAGAPGAAQPASGTPGISNQTCSSAQISRLGCQNGCAITSGGFAQCTYKEGDMNCTTAHSGVCASNATKYGLETGKCVVIDRLPRCEYKQDAAKCNDDDAKCSGGTSCQFFTKNNTKYSACASGTAAQSAAAVGAPAGPVDLLCGKDDKGIDIPCYSIGVFSPAELAQREAQAQLSSINYAKFRSILDNEAKDIDETIKVVARKAIADAEAAQQACLKGQK